MSVTTLVGVSVDPTIEPRIELGESVLRAVRGRHAFEGCVEQLATAIRLGVYPRGSALPPERELAERMGVSRATLREAIAALRSAEFVNTTRGRGGGTVVSYRPRVVLTNSAERSAAMASRNVARETPIRSASSRSGGRVLPRG